EATAEAFFKSPYFAVVGASGNEAKFGHIVFTWYIDENLPVTPINPSTRLITVHDIKYPTTKDVLSLPHPSETALSFLTQTDQTRKALEEAKEVGVQAVWFQHGSVTPEDFEYAQREFKIVVGGHVGTDAHDGWCVLVHGKKAIR
ncbi:NAD(P)-binding protein, partial [Mollisia scopiformis]